MNEFILAQTTGGQIVEVSPQQGKCGCGETNCMHLQLATDIYLRGGRRSIWYVLSSYHKEIRRCDLERAICWGKIYCRITSPNHLLKYTERIVLEESRDFHLLLQIKSGQISPLQAVSLLCQAPKKWTLEYLSRAGHFEQWLESHKRFSADPSLWDAGRLEKTLLSFTTLAEGYQTLFATSKNSSMKKLFWKAVRVRLGKQPCETSEAFLRAASSGYYPRQVAIEVILGLHPKSSPNVAEIPERANFLPSHRAYANDIHSSAGKTLFKKLLPRIVAGEDVSGFGYDMRVSGSVYGAAWRAAAYKQHGNRMWDCAWSDVVIPYPVLDILAMDQFFYPGLIPSHLMASSSSN